jgi:hypothetical protein
MELGWAMAMLALAGDRLSRLLYGNAVWALALVALGALSLPLYLLFATTRFATASARWGFAVAVFVHCVAQVIAIGLLSERRSPLVGIGQTYVMIASFVAVALPLWIGWRQHVLKRAARLARA